MCLALIGDVHLHSLPSPGQTRIFWVPILEVVKHVNKHVNRLNPEQLLHRFMIDDCAAIAGRRPSHLCMCVCGVLNTFAFIMSTIVIFVNCIGL